MVQAEKELNTNPNAPKRKGRLAARYNTINLIFIVIILAVTIAVASFMLNTMVETASRDYARSYTMESVDILSLHLSKEILLVQQAAEAPELIEWFKDEEDSEKRAAAFRKMELYARMQQLGGLNFAVFESQNEYFIGENTSLEEFTPVNELDPFNVYDKWYFTTINSIFDFTMRTSVHRSTDAHYLWLNQKVIDNGVTVGVLSSALELDEIFQDLFGLYEKQNALGLVIDHRGIIQMDSTAASGASGSVGSLASEETHVLTVFTDVDFISIINNDYLRIPTVQHGRRSEPEVIRLSEGDYSYMAIARVPNTNWITITFFDSATLFDISSILPPLITVIIALLVYLVASTMLNRRLVIEPLEKLTQSLSSHDKNGIYGTDRNDEIGQLALTTQTAINEREDAVEEALKANESKSAFLANMSHEIRTPMNSIIGFSELAMDYEMHPKLRDYFTNILNNSEWLLQIINDILDISKIESGKMELENIPFNLNDMFNSCRTLILPKAQDKGLMLYFYAEPSLGKKLCGDPTRLRQVLVNLLSNAVKFTSTGMIKMQSAVRNISKDTVTIYFEVKDSGIGMTTEQLERVFSPFEQAETSITRNYGGTGLGLSITKSIIEMMGGTLSVESTSGVGTKFSFELVFDAIDSDKTENIADRITFNELEKPTFEGEILLCEDNTMNQQVITEHLGRVGLKCVVADNGKIGVDLVKKRMEKGEKQFDLIFMDMHMPVMDGLEAAAVIRDMETGVPVVAMTANIMIEDREIYSTLGMNDCVGKPFTSQELWRCLMKYLKPVSWMKEDAKKQERTDKELQRKLIASFVKNNSAAAVAIKDAIDDGDITLAHRIAHTLKSNAGQLGKTLLQKAAGDVENLLTGGVNKATPKHLTVLENELRAVIIEFTPMAQESAMESSQQKAPGRLDEAAARELLEKLEPLLDEGDADSLSFTDDLRGIEGSDALIEFIDNFEFQSAHEELIRLLERDNA